MSGSSRADRLVAGINALPIEEVRRRIAEAQGMSAEEIEARQAVERRERAERAAAQIRDSLDEIDPDRGEK